MLILKYLVLIEIIIISSYLGIMKAKKYENRLEALKQLLNALVMFKSKIEFTYEPIYSVFKDISKVIYKDNDNIFLNSINNQTNNINFLWCNAVDKDDNFFDEDKQIIKMFGKLLGKTDLNGQVSELNLSMSFIENQIKKAEIDKNKNVKLYKSLGVILGIGICIIFV